MSDFNSEALNNAGQNGMKQTVKSVITNRWFELSITLVIIVNSLLIGVETYHTHSTVTMIQNLILYIFTIE